MRIIGKYKCRVCAQTFSQVFNVEAKQMPKAITEDTSRGILFMLRGNSADISTHRCDVGPYDEAQSQTFSVGDLQEFYCQSSLLSLDPKKIIIR